RPRGDQRLSGRRRAERGEGVVPGSGHRGNRLNRDRETQMHHDNITTCADMDVAARPREKAEQIAGGHHAALTIWLDDAGIQITTDLDSMTRRALTAAALAALTEKETAR